AGWGRVEVSGDVRGGSDVRVEITNCVFCSAGAAARGGRCDFIAGVAEGLAKATYGHEYRTGHVDAGVGAETKCTILVSRTSHPDGEWKASVFFPWMMSKDGAP
ncbi:MAG TPA: hypothetical protein VJR06_03575, partial [Nitrososphaerales archaeon]|nr:hypothetical protein [Nitrososphaerales archaeon]